MRPKISSNDCEMIVGGCEKVKKTMFGLHLIVVLNF